MEAVERNGAVELNGHGGGPWLMRLERTLEPATAANNVAPAAAALVGSLGQTLTPVATLMQSTASSGAALKVVFSPDVQRGLAQGTLRLMGSAKGGYPVAVNQLGRIREVATVMPAAGVLAGPALLPILLPAVAAAGAAYFQHRWLEKRLDEIKQSLHRVESRLRDNDFAVLEAADALTEAMMTGSGWDIPDQLRLELAVARQEVERVFRSRRRHVVQALDWVDDERRGLPNPWTETVKRLFSETHLVTEIATYVQAMAVRARLTSATSFVLATDSAAATSVRMLEDAELELRSSYDRLVSTLAPLAERRPDGNWMHRIPGVSKGDSGFRKAVDMVDHLKADIGEHLPDRSRTVELTLAPHQLLSLADGTINLAQTG
ncbi:MAG: hypothetical protein IT193_18100 [Propionibacteriaceae bacterium]|nr:hypothetical protein [Propionibacteriaceae bacterium]